MSNKLVKVAEDSARGGFSLFLGNTLSIVILAVGSILVARLLGARALRVQTHLNLRLNTLASECQL